MIEFRPAPFGTVIPIAQSRLFVAHIPTGAEISGHVNVPRSYGWSPGFAAPQNDIARAVRCSEDGIRFASVMARTNHGGSES